MLKHVYDKGPHGYGQGKKGTPVGTWSLRLVEWLRGLGASDVGERDPAPGVR